MKLKNKKTGEIGELTMSFNEMTNEKRICVEYIEAHGKDFWREKKYYNSLADLNDKWEDYEESKEYWTIDWTCTGVTTNKYSGDDVDDFNEAIGNYFETKEEAEKAVEKLKAWKRLKDKGFRFDGYNACSVDYDIDEQYRKYISEDLDLLFGGEE